MAKFSLGSWSQCWNWLTSKVCYKCFVCHWAGKDEFFGQKMMVSAAMNYGSVWEDSPPWIAFGFFLAVFLDLFTHLNFLKRNWSSDFVSHRNRSCSQKSERPYFCLILKLLEKIVFEQKFAHNLLTYRNSLIFFYLFCAFQEGSNSRYDLLWQRGCFWSPALAGVFLVFMRSLVEAPTNLNTTQTRQTWRRTLE